MKAEVGAMIYATISQKLRNKTPVPMFYRGNKSRVRQCVKLCVTVVFQLLSNSNTHKHLRNFYTPGFHITQHNITRTMLACFTCKLLPAISFKTHWLFHLDLCFIATMQIKAQVKRDNDTFDYMYLIRCSKFIGGTFQMVLRVTQ